MTELEKGPQGRRRGRGARERILSASQRLFRDHQESGTNDQFLGIERRAALRSGQSRAPAGR